MSIGGRIAEAWRKNSAELVAWRNGALPAFVTARTPAELPGVPVFCYHLVEPEIFEADLAFLRRNGYSTLRSAELLAYLAEGASVAERSVVLTFDDGPRNFHDVAFPLLEKYGMRAIAFIAPGLHADVEPDDCEARPMSWPELKAVAASGLVELQSHTYESRFVPRWPMPVPLAGCRQDIEASRRRKPVSLERDLLDSRRAIVDRLPGATVEHLAFPMYEGTEEGVRCAASAGFRACYWGLIPGRGLNRPGDSPLEISRLSDEFVRRLPGDGRMSLADAARERVRRARAARAWRRRYASSGKGR